MDSLQYSPTWYLDYETGLEYAILPFEQTFDDAVYSCSTYTTSQIASLASINSKVQSRSSFSIYLYTSIRLYGCAH